ncbi:hypothetical protein RLEG3_13990 [Rhizobium leguminosarum bv. trifolii WSM1689]|uniref:Uncharacterized protein n=1 Tax=Rhizobium laguerreae TaxID=1076926 RepID=A0ABR6G518_9HYPH|nr:MULTISPECIES: hypothetical protein [Rhizobium]AHF82860.1 hypothetical protein RLEG3_13990 [Rhizobium leguminosarum bv. trifolii WSM1689]MBB3161365.1 hypothetical protein [Rhizobium laguerreae]MBN9987564.1 hypothetical protein [Rhizobium laguerreae]MBY3315709.1 hypothetical protein [Rhizobium laguerreae]MBY3360328.1 hypothetical protein [Rhizobium laguerreae]
MSAANLTPGSTESSCLPRAKARFTAGAPDLLKALVEAERFFDGSKVHGCALHRKILDAIDTVKGGAA